jgi:hypothetical protein
MIQFAITTLPAAGQTINEYFKLLPSDGAADDRFGQSVAISGNTAIVGAYYDADNGFFSGSAYLFDTTTGQQLFKLLPNDGVKVDFFGISVAMSGNTAIVGAERDDDNGGDSGSAYIFDTTTGQQLFKLLPSDGAQGDNFGESVAISGTTAIVGTRFDDDNGIDSGSAYLFDTATGQQIDKLLPSDGAAGDWFGNSVAISGTTGIVGASLDSDNGEFSGSAYLFDTTTGQQLFKLLPNDGAEFDNFGFSVAISGTTAIVGALGDDDNGSLSGSAYIFDTTTGQQLFKLLPNDGEADDRFGWSVAISGTLAIVGAYDDDDNGDRSGSAYIFDTTTGQQIAKILPSDGAADDNFGRSVAISGTTAIVGAYFDDDNGDRSGSAYLFTAPAGPTINEDDKLLPSDGAAGDRFGQSVAMSGNTAIVGADRDDDNGADSGSAYLFDTTTGQQLLKLLPSDGRDFDNFGNSVSISGNTAIVGAREDDNRGISSGSAYIFDTTTGQQLFMLLPSDGAQADRFGWSVAISGTTAIVGTTGDDDSGSASGSAYLFNTITGQQLFKLLPSDGAAFDNFGYSVAMSGSTAIVGATGDDDSGSASGSAYLFDTTTGQQLFKLLPSDGAADDTFGDSVAISGTTAIVGAPGDGDNGSASGSAYLFDTTTGQQLFKLLPNDGAEFDNFGGSVAISGALAIIGAYDDDDNGNRSGSAYLFDTTTGQQLLKLLPSDGAEDDFFGLFVAISGPTAIVGARLDDDNGVDSGTAYIFSTTPSLCSADLNGDGSLNFFDVSAFLIAYADNDLIADFNADGQFNFFDVSAFLTAYLAGCP